MCYFSRPWFFTIFTMDLLELLSEAYLHSQDRKAEFLSDPDIEKIFKEVHGYSGKVVAPKSIMPPVNL